MHKLHELHNHCCTIREEEEEEEEASVGEVYPDPVATCNFIASRNHPLTVKSGKKAKFKVRQLSS